MNKFVLVAAASAAFAGGHGYVYSSDDLKNIGTNAGKTALQLKISKVF